MQYLILSCSAKKSVAEDELSAIDRYKGVFFSIFKKAINSRPILQREIRLFIISAKYGLIESADTVDNYDLKMTNKLAAEQCKYNTQKLMELVQRDKPKVITAVMGQTYLKSIDLSMIPAPICIINGEIGTMLHAFKEWLDKLNGGSEDAN